MSNAAVLHVRKSRLEGRVSLAGAKNSALRLLAASILTRDTLELRNYPAGLLDTQVHVDMLRALGKSAELLGTDSIRITESESLASQLKWEGRSIRNTLLILGALTARLGAGSVPLPGGCKLGERKYDLHVMLLERLGARVWEDDAYLYAEAPNGLVGADIHLPMRSTGATENAILAGTLAKGTTRVWNPHIRPEILDLIAMLNSMGACITVFGQEHIEIQGVDALHGTEHRVIADNMEAITWLSAAVITGGDIEIADFPYADLEVVLAHLRSAGARLYVGDDSLIVRGGACYPIEISTGPHPGINSDVQPILAAWGARARGESRIVDLRFPGRYGYAEEMAKMGVKYNVDGDMLRIHGQGGVLHGAVVRALDLRAGAALTLCGLTAEGETIVTDAWQISRGYVDFAEKLRAMGADVRWG
ncbi:UDP-N-acetylglucosamine 1-carboxyvinyltransferase [Stenotrophomonas maltophilia]|jgi:UDP-N-acetylglucosamine 1-carboxyvinyltransferase|uniref:UDP-N-acetylglucosamine 1-carboxyvinyltransferase n=1 Tax=Stenotrophomonas TaxID=40323 RepID=UPI0006AC2556|nr:MULTISPECIES: UDP-N-acetylglucosamine 1-carboxyvinyltransferase [Stenotrophomonas]KOQ69370.1 UDP-N-acetylglucosamine 1-carboxyvinyltransferase [Stenotrophomonas maltophilia]MBH1590920.1 UDP-N-acetylglucosamine 1-carboxyvinyltransferase [Stenotrophomonas maltophilia]MBH1664347.1 UDP-N-acetylglucosamine 1-carboxyvinyltransferase [Stenotrophomonas maltophilia]MBH1835069.1 UDP-N-acetylglucosamine 1-carboxyvinyltransferase [Stenotrophomonas maltophilia]MBN4937500.1 UDP-N-acetylglucosamine 1-carb